MFILENSCTELSRWFSKVTLRRYKDVLVVTDAEPLVAYVQSGKFLVDSKLIEFRRHVEKEIKLHGAVRITKAPGIFEACRDDSA